MGADDVLGYGEAEAGASGFAGAGFVDAIEAFEEAWQMFRRNARAKVAHEEFHAMVGGTRPEFDARAGTPILHRVVDQVGENLVDGFAVG